eukprot:jgi/Bigna1/72222/fgenesh1_pg.19_\
MELRPGQSLGPFRLGQPLSEVIGFLRNNGMEYRRVQMQFNVRHPCRSDICLVAKNVGMRLRFCAHLQLLKLIDVYDAKQTSVTYEGKDLMGPSVVPSFSLVSRVLGPTFPGRFHRERKVFMLQYPGVCVMFPVNSEIYHGPSSSSSSEVRIEDLEQTDPTASRFFVHAGKSCLERLRLPTPDSSNCLYFEPIVVKINRGIRFGKRKRSLLFRRHSLQHVLSVLGTPDQVHVKEADSMRIHRPSDGKQGKDAPGERDYFLNYFKLGMDILIDGAAHTLKKIVLHTNMPATRNFNRYNRCGRHSSVAPTTLPSSSSPSFSALSPPQNGILPSSSSSSSSPSPPSSSSVKQASSQRMAAEGDTAGTTNRSRLASKKKTKRKKVTAGKSSVRKGAAQKKEEEDEDEGGDGEKDMPQNSLSSNNLPNAAEEEEERGDDNSDDSKGVGTKGKKDHQPKSEDKSKVDSSHPQQPRVITFSTRWEEVQQILGEAGRPMTNDPRRGQRAQ